MKFIYDKDLNHIKVSDNGEPLVDIRDFSTKIKVRLEKESRDFFGRNTCLVRKSVAMKLARIQESLNGVNLVIIDGYRPVELQKRMYDDFCRKTKAEHPGWNKKEVELEASKFIAPVSAGVVPPHSTGGTVDLMLEKGGRLLDMGTGAGELSMKSATSSRLVSEAARRNRRMLAGLMKKEGFVNYPLEWWHWSYGDRTWAYYKAESVSFYNKVPYGKVIWK